MTPFEYILPLVSVLVGLAVADLAVSLHRLLRGRRRVRWDWLPLAAALLALLAVLEMWWLFYASREAAFFTTLGGFLPFAAQLILLFLLNAAALPDDVPPEGLDLRAFYDANGPYFWSLYTAYAAFAMLARIGGAVGGLPEGMSLPGLIVSLVVSVLLLGLFVALARVRRRSFHAVAVVVLLGLLLVEWAGLRLGAA